MKKRKVGLTILTPEPVPAAELTFNGKPATAEVLREAAGTACAICNGTDISAHVAMIVATSNKVAADALQRGDADARFFAICASCESTGPEAFGPAIQRRLMRDMGIES